MFVVPYVKLSSLLFPQLCNNLIIPVTLISELLQQQYPRTMAAHTTDTAHTYVGGYLIKQHAVFKGFPFARKRKFYIIILLW